MRLLLFSGIVAACLLSNGCTQYWYQESKTFKECELDYRLCVEELKKYSELQDFGEYEFQFMKECMESKGYQAVTESELPIKVKRQDPEWSLHWKLKGLAGPLETP